MLTDEKWLIFVLEQILSNALKYTKSGSIHIYLSPDAPKTLVIEDTGIGIAPEDLPRISKRLHGCERPRRQAVNGHRTVSVPPDHGETFAYHRIESEMGVGTKVYLGLDTVSL
mgnify:CR=1 FL=1